MSRSEIVGAPPLHRRDGRTSSPVPATANQRTVPMTNRHRTVMDGGRTARRVKALA